MRTVGIFFDGYTKEHAGDVYRMINVQTRKVTETRNVTFLGKMFGEIYDLEIFLSYQTLHERYVSEEEFFDTGLKNIKEEDD